MKAKEQLWNFQIKGNQKDMSLNATTDPRLDTLLEGKFYEENDQFKWQTGKWIINQIKSVLVLNLLRLMKVLDYIEKYHY